MAEVQQQLQVLADELNLMKNELVGLKANHSACKASQSKAKKKPPE